MNKLSIVVLLAVCLLSVQAFVKRDAAVEVPSNENYIDKAKTAIHNFGKQLDETLDIEAISKKFNELVDRAKKAINDVKSNPATQ